MEAALRISAVQRAYGASPPRREHVTSAEAAIQRLDRCCTWLADNDVQVIAMYCTSFSVPVCFVTARPEVYILFSGSYERIRQRQNGALRYETWEATDPVNNVKVRWEEVIACM